VIMRWCAGESRFWKIPPNVNLHSVVFSFLLLRVVNKTCYDMLKVLKKLWE